MPSNPPRAFNSLDTSIPHKFCSRLSKAVYEQVGTLNFYSGRCFGPNLNSIDLLL